MVNRDKLLKKASSTATRMVPTEPQNITKERIRDLLPKRTSVSVTDEVIRLIHNMEDDTGLPQELLEEDFLGYIHLVTSGNSNSLTELVNAIKFCNLKRNYTNKEAWSITFPTKYNRLVEENMQIDNHVSMYNASKLVVAVDKEMLIPIHLQYAPYFHASVKKQFDLMNGKGTSKDKEGNFMKVTPMVQHLAAKELANLTRQPEETKLDISINPGAAAVSMQEEMNEQLRQLVAGQRQRLIDGEDIIDVQTIGLDFSDVGRERE